MKSIKFEAGKTYGNWNTDLTRTVEKRTPCYVWVKGCKRLVHETSLFDLDGDWEAVEYIEICGTRYYACCDWEWIQK